MIQAILLTNNEIVIAQSIPQTDEDTGAPYFSLMYPYLLSMSTKAKKIELVPWLSYITDSKDEFIVYPDKIITMKTPNDEIVSKYKKLVLFDEDKIIKDVVIDEKEKIENEKKDLDLVLPRVADDEIDEVFEEGMN